MRGLQQRTNTGEQAEVQRKQTKYINRSQARSVRHICNEQLNMSRSRVQHGDATVIPVFSFFFHCFSVRPELGGFGFECPVTAGPFIPAANIVKLSDINWSCPYLHSGACKLLKIMTLDVDDNVAYTIDLSLKQLGHPVSPGSSTAKQVLDHAKKACSDAILQHSVMPAIPGAARRGANTDNAFLLGVCWNKPFLLSYWVKMELLLLVITIYSEIEARGLARGLRNYKQMLLQM